MNFERSGKYIYSVTDVRYMLYFLIFYYYKQFCLIVIMNNLIEHLIKLNQLTAATV